MSRTQRRLPPPYSTFPNAKTGVVYDWFKDDPVLMDEVQTLLDALGGFDPVGIFLLTTPGGAQLEPHVNRRLARLLVLLMGIDKDIDWTALEQVLAPTPHPHQPLSVTRPASSARRSPRS
jgi:hypothetical protein